ncbi:hypothetical protein [Flagellimonas sp.]|uniref:hypothetical protein n=1 Tax=Flagellimonas sp. TaxID=2058762 RepID=UPI003B5241E0
MKMRKLAHYALLASWAFVQFGCGKDDSPSNPDDGPTETFYNITQATINTDGYTAPGELSFWYSIDNGESYSIEKPEDLSKGDELWVKINNGEVDILEEDFYFDWSGSSIAPADAESDLAKFVVKESDITLAATVSDKMELLVSDRDTGQFYVLDVSDGGLTPAFTFLQGEVPLIKVRGAVYNYSDGKMYVSTAKIGNFKSMLYIVDPNSKQATVINENNQIVNEENVEIWKGISDLVVTTDNNLLATGGFSLGQGTPSLFEFELEGTNSDPMPFTGDDIPCCGLGMTLGSNSDEVFIGSGQADVFKVYKSNLSGEITEVIELTLEGFEHEEPIGYYLRNFARDASGTLYALCYNLTHGNTHIAEVNLETNQLIHVAQIGTNNENVYYGLVALPAYAF